MSEESPSPPSATPNPALDEKARGFLQTWAESIAQVLGQIAGAPLPVECGFAAPPAAPPHEEADLHFMVSSSGSLRGEMSLRLPKTAVLGLAQLFLGEPQDATAELKPDHQEAIAELLRQIAGHAATALKPAWGEVQLRVEPGAPPTWSAAATGWCTSAGETPRVQLEWQLSPALHAVLLASPTTEVTAADRPEPRGPVNEVNQDALPEHFELLRDVELEVTLRFGERTLLLREVLELGPGSVVELDRKIEEPVDLLLDGRLMARGEVVIVDGNYGLRVLEVLTPATG